MILDLNEDSSENVPYSYPGYFIFIEKDCLSQYPQHTGLSHWHDDVEFIAVLSGEMDYNVNGQVTTIHTGEGLFVNSRQFHHGFSKDRGECEFLCILLHPMLLCATSSMEQDFVAPLLANTAFASCPLRSSIPWEHDILLLLLQMYDSLDQPAFPLLIQGLFSQIWQGLYAHAPKEQPQSAGSSNQLSAVREMVGYIQKHYQEKISLDAIAASGGVCKSKCSSLFRDYLNQTPMNYLIKYRLEKSIELMASTDLNITQISYEVGFSGASYFSETFRKHFGCSPVRYRKEIRDALKDTALTPLRSSLLS